ncbi:MAG: hypothetical protein RL417_571 [Pseudomonadota bacterium]|jgi:uncharacterized lipoprotein NlpE involved in copper resistance
MKKQIVVIALFLGLSGCIHRQQYDYNYPDYPYYITHDRCGSASAAECAWAKSQVSKISEETSAVTWGSAVALTLLASIDVEPES